MASSERSKVTLTDRVVMVTGANTGLGYEIAKEVAFHGATVILACRSEERGIQAIERMNQDLASKKAKGSKDMPESLALEVLRVDLASFQSVLQFVEAFKASERKLHVLFLNAGMGLHPYAKTEDGYEIFLQVNYLSHFIMTAKLLPIMKASGPDCRIILTSSEAHSWTSFDLDEINYTGPPEQFPELKYYSRSKLYQIMQMFCMVRRLSGSAITVNCINPGPVATDFGRNAGNSSLALRTAWWLVKNFCPSPARAARSGINCVVNPDLAGVTGRYYDTFWRSASATSRDEQKQEALWKKTFELVGQYITDEEREGMEGGETKWRH